HDPATIQPVEEGVVALRHVTAGTSERVGGRLEALQQAAPKQSRQLQLEPFRLASLEVPGRHVASERELTAGTVIPGVIVVGQCMLELLEKPGQYGIEIVVDLANVRLGEGDLHLESADAHGVVRVVTAHEVARA